MATTHLPSPLPSGRAESAPGATAGVTSRLRSTRWLDGDPVARGATLVLALMLVGGAYVLVRRSWDQQQVFRNAQTVRRHFWIAPNLYEAVRILEPRSAFREIAEIALDAATHREGRLTDRIGPNDWIAICVQRSAAAVDVKLRRGISFLDTVGTTAPLIGLLATVWGIHGSMTRIANEPAWPIGSVLLSTVAGLAVAALAMVGRSWLGARNERASAAVHEFADDVQAVLLSANAAIDSAALPRPSAVSDRSRRS